MSAAPGRRPPWARPVAVVATVMAALVPVALAGCGQATTRPRTLTVFAAASLTEAFTALERRFEADHPDVDVRLSFQGSSVLATQITNGAPAEVFASADQVTMHTVIAAGLVTGEPIGFASNRMTIVVPVGNPHRIGSLADLSTPDLRIAVCQPQAPCGSATKKVLAAAAVTLPPASEEQDVKGVLNKVRSGNADAGLVYVTDINSSAGQVSSVDFPEAALAIGEYQIAVLTDADTELAGAFVGLVRGEVGRGELARVGFAVP
jgi:molybdate transport system substrate-binding protein